MPSPVSSVGLRTLWPMITVFCSWDTICTSYLSFFFMASTAILNIFFSLLAEGWSDTRSMRFCFCPLPLALCYHPRAGMTGVNVQSLHVLRLLQTLQWLLSLLKQRRMLLKELMQPFAANTTSWSLGVSAYLPSCLSLIIVPSTS